MHNTMRAKFTFQRTQIVRQCQYELWYVKETTIAHQNREEQSNQETEGQRSK